MSALLKRRRVAAVQSGPNRHGEVLEKDSGTAGNSNEFFVWGEHLCCKWRRSLIGTQQLVKNKQVFWAR
jgi:hypothetical protein